MVECNEIDGKFNNSITWILLIDCYYEIELCLFITFVLKINYWTI